MACQTHCCVFTRGEFLIADYFGPVCNGAGLDELLCGIQKPFRKVGNVSSCAVNITTEVLGTENKYNPTHDVCARIPITAVELTITLECASKENLYQALFSKKHPVEQGTQSDVYCIHSIGACDFFPFKKYLADEESVVATLRNPFGAITYTLVKDVDYIYHKTGIEIINDAIVMGTSTSLYLEYDFDSTNYFEIDFGSEKQGYKSLIFKGINFSDDENALFDATFHKVIFSPVAGFDLITQDGFFTLTLSGKVEKHKDSWFKFTKEEG